MVHVSAEVQLDRRLSVRAPAAGGLARKILAKPLRRTTRHPGRTGPVTRNSHACLREVGTGRRSRPSKHRGQTRKASGNPGMATERSSS
jgi:hypothetical protein